MLKSVLLLISLFWWTQAMAVDVATLTHESKSNLEAGLLATESRVKALHYRQGLEKAEMAREAAPDDPQLVLLWVANSGELAGVQKNLSSLITIPKIEKELKRLTETSPDIQFAAPFRALGYIYLRAPRFFSLGSISKAESHLAEASKRFPNWPENKMAMAEFYLVKEKWKEAAEILDRFDESDFAQGDTVQKKLWARDLASLRERLQQERQK